MLYDIGISMNQRVTKIQTIKQDRTVDYDKFSDNKF